ncbi:MAG: hypothetical protein IKO01_04735 [Kiritimatiellae bacterium]|nr:hypothetical protein [Kiritimatiellia bacterium]
MKFWPKALFARLGTVIDWLETHQGLCMVLLTAALAWSAFVSCHLSAKNIQAMKDMEIERTRPMVVLEYLQEMPLYGVRLRNAGLTAARDVIVHTVPGIELCFDDPEKPPIRFLKEKIDFLPPNASCQAMLGTMPQIQRINKTLVYRGTIQYADAMGRQYTEEVVLDYTLFGGTWYSGKTHIHEIVEELENMQGAINGNLHPQGSNDGGFSATISFSRKGGEKTEAGKASGKEENPPHGPTNGAGGMINEPINGKEEPITEPIHEPVKFGKESIHARVLEHVRQHPGEKRGDIVEALGIPLSTVGSALKALGERVEYRGSKRTGGYYAKDE